MEFIQLQDKSYLNIIEIKSMTKKKCNQTSGSYLELTLLNDKVVKTITRGFGFVYIDAVEMLKKLKRRV